MRSDIPHTEVHFSEWSEMKKFFDKLGTVWVFRGQRSVEWPLASSLERLSLDRAPHRAEEYLLTQFKRRAHHYIPPPLPGSNLEWMAMMQHHGAPTRFLDFTYSPYIATFFAMEDALEECSVWAINSHWLKRGTFKQLEEKARLLPPFSDRKFCLRDLSDLVRYRGFATPVYDWFEDILFSNGERFVIGVEPFLMNERVIIQGGVFLVPASVQRSFHENLASNGTKDMAKYVIKIIIDPSAFRKALLDIVDRMNISRASLFPGIDGFAQSLRLVGRTHCLWDFMLHRLRGRTVPPLS